MNGPWQMTRQRDFTGGENLDDLPELFGPNQLARMENVIISPEGFIKSSFQLDRSIYSGTNLDLAGMVFQQMPSTTQYTYWHTSGPLVSNIYTGTYNPTGPAINTDDDASVFCDGADIQGLTLAVEYLGKAYCINAAGGVLNLTDSVLITDGNLATMPLVRLVPYMNRLYGITDAGNIIFSDNGDAATWDPLNIVRLPAWEKAIDFKPVQGGVIVYSRKSVYAMYGSDYTDIALVRLKEGVMLSDGAVELDNTIYICGNRGMYAASLNGVQEIPHHQNAYFREQYRAWTANETGNVQGVYLYKYHAIKYLFRSDVGSQGFIFYLKTGAFTKQNESLDADRPYMLALENGSVEFLRYRNKSEICAGRTHVDNLDAARVSTIATPHSDLGTGRSKVIREFALTTAQIVSGVTINAYLDYSTTPIVIAENVMLIAGDNRFFLSMPRCKTVCVEIVVDSDGPFTFKEIRVKHREAGPVI